MTKLVLQNIYYQNIDIALSKIQYTPSREKQIILVNEMMHANTFDRFVRKYLHLDDTHIDLTV